MFPDIPQYSNMVLTTKVVVSIIFPLIFAFSNAAPVEVPPEDDIQHRNNQRVRPIYRYLHHADGWSADNHNKDLAHHLRGKRSYLSQRSNIDDSGWALNEVDDGNMDMDDGPVPTFGVKKLMNISNRWSGFPSARSRFQVS
jgi:hypothetical protein